MLNREKQVECAQSNLTLYEKSIYSLLRQQITVNAAEKLFTLDKKCLWNIFVRNSFVPFTAF